MEDWSGGVRGSAMELLWVPAPGSQQPQRNVSGSVNSLEQEVTRSSGFQ